MEKYLPLTTETFLENQENRTLVLSKKNLNWPSVNSEIWVLIKDLSAQKEMPMDLKTKKLTLKSTVENLKKRICHLLSKISPKLQERRTEASRLLIMTSRCSRVPLLEARNFENQPLARRDSGIRRDLRKN